MAVTSEGTAAGLAPEPVLVVDDDPVQHALVGKYLQNWPVRHAYSAPEALHILQREDILLVILDLYMPEMDGMEMLRRVKRHNGIVQVMVVTASEEAEDLLRALEAGANDFLLKPLDKRSLEDALENALARINRWKCTLLELFQRKKRVHQELEKAASIDRPKILQP
jgi:CheY-like chemotaxis protein